MIIAVIAANGRTGKEFVDLALNAGHDIRAGVFGKHDFKPNKKLKIIQCDATNIDDLKTLCNGAEVIASFIGHGKKSPPTVQTDAIKTAIEVASQLRVQRLVSLTGTGVRYPGDKITIIDRILNVGIALADPKRVADGKSHARLLENSTLQFTILRVLKLTNSNTSTFTLTLSGPVKTLTSRREVAQAALQVIEDKTFIRQAPIVSRDP